MVLNRSMGALIPVILKRYPDAMNVIATVINQTSNGAGFNMSQICSTVRDLFGTTRDLCNAPVGTMGSELKQVCVNSSDNATLIDGPLHGICSDVKPTDRPLTIKPTDRPLTILPTFPPIVSDFPSYNFTGSISNMSGGGNDFFVRPMLVSNSFFISIKALTGTILVAYRRKCKDHKGTFHEATLSCFKNSTRIILDTDAESLKIISMLGNIISLLSLIVLVAGFIVFKKHETLPGKNIMFLSCSMALAHLTQFILILVSKTAWACRTGAVVLHWSLLLAFASMAVLAYDSFRTFSKLRPSDPTLNRKRFKRNLIGSFAFATVIVFICLMIDIPGERFAGYGLNGVCFLSRFWANLFAFVVPVAAILLSNIVLLTITIIKLRKIKESTEKALKSAASAPNKRKKIVLSALVLKLSILFGLGWILAFIDSLHYNKGLRYLYTILIALQGFLVFLCFGCHHQCWVALKTKICKAHRRLPSQSATDTTLTTDHTAF